MQKVMCSMCTSAAPGKRASLQCECLVAQTNAYAHVKCRTGSSPFGLKVSAQPVRGVALACDYAEGDGRSACWQCALPNAHPMLTADRMHTLTVEATLDR